MVDEEVLIKQDCQYKNKNEGRFVYQLFNSDNLALNDRFSNTRLTKNCF
jgi:hypothetical protein